MKKRIAYALTSFLLLNSWANAQMAPMKTLHAGQIKHELKKLKTLGSVLYVAAHPDDENTRLITYLANAEGYETTYLSLTRGDGGQNLIGKEVREELGVIRTQELLAARRTDGGKQRFSRANDFGYSKTPEETFRIWNREEVLADAVWTIRLLQPDVLITRFSPTLGGTHGHHTGSAILAVEAFELAADPKAFPEQLKYVKTWQAKRILWNTSPWFYSRNGDTFDPSDKVKIDVGGYDALLGKSYGEIAALSRSQHQCQGFGAALQRGEIEEWLAPLKGEPTANNQLFSGIETSWKRVPNSKNLEKLIEKAYQEFKVETPAASLPALAAILGELKKLDPENNYVKRKTEAVENLMVQCAGIWVEAAPASFSVVPGQNLPIEVRAINRSTEPVILEEVDFGISRSKLDSTLTANQLKESKLNLTLPESLPYSSPYWLNDNATVGMYAVNDPLLRGTPQNQPAIAATFTLHFPAQKIKIKKVVPLMYRWVDPSKGELYRPLEVVPAVTVAFDAPVYLLTSAKNTKEVSVKVQAQKDQASGTVSIATPQGWQVTPAQQPFQLNKKGQEQTYTFTLSTEQAASDLYLKAVATHEGKTYTQQLTRIDYGHIPVQTLLPTATARLVKIDLQKKGQRIGYLMGAGDAVPEALTSIGYEVELLSEADISAEKLATFDAVITGVRAYNTLDAMPFHHEKLLAYVKNRGTLIIQYNTNQGLKVKADELAPYTLKLSRDRITEEDADMVFIDPQHEIVNSPNKLTKADFDGWVQERGLYFPNEWGPEFTPIFKAADQGEKETSGALLVADYGSGKYIYTGLSFFRELPAGVPGAYRLLTNLISYGKKENP